MPQEQINLKEKNVTELKALAFDLDNVVKQYQGMLQTVTQELQGRLLEEQSRAISQSQPQPQQEEQASKPEEKLKSKVRNIKQ